MYRTAQEHGLRSFHAIQSLSSYNIGVHVLIGIGFVYLFFRLSRYRYPLIVLLSWGILALLFVLTFLWHFALGMRVLYREWRAHRAMCLRRRVDVARPYGSAGRRAFAFVRWPIHGHRL